MRIFILLVLVCIGSSTLGQLDSNLIVFQELSGFRIDSVNATDDWEMNMSYFPSGRKHDEVRTFVSAGCLLEGNKCIMRYQHQQYYDMDEETFSLKEGKYITIKKGKASYTYYGYWYDNNAKLYRKIKEKTSKKL